MRDGDSWLWCTVGDLAASKKNALVGGPFGSNLVSADYVSTGVPVIRGQNMGLGRWVSGDFVFVSVEKAEELKANTAVPGDLVFTQRGTLGQVAIVPEGPVNQYVVSQSQMKLSVDEYKVDTLFLYYLFTGEEQQDYIRRNAMQTGVPHTNLGILRNTPVRLPPKDKQVAIGRILGSLDDKIELNSRVHQDLEAVARAIFKSWFMNFDPVGEGHPLFPSGFKDSVIGPIPLSWRAEALSHLCKVALGGDWGEDDPFEHAVEAACLRGVDLEQLRKAGEARPPCRWVKPSSVEKRRMSGRDVIVAGSGAGPVGRTLWISPALAENFDLPLIYSNFCKRLTADSVDVAIYIDFVMDEMRNTGETFDYVTGTSVPNLDLQGLLRRMVPVPSPQILKAFASIVTPIRERLYSGENRTLAALRDALLPKLLSGEIRVKQAEKIVGEAV